MDNIRESFNGETPEEVTVRGLKQLNVTLLNKPDLTIAEIAIRQCHDSMDKSDMVVKDGKRLLNTKGKDLISRVGMKMKHESTLEHIVYSFEIDGITRACLQELARHRIASYTVKSSRYTLKELKDEEPFETFSYTNIVRASKYVRFTNDLDVNRMILSSLNILIEAVKTGKSNDVIKYLMPECYKTKLTMTMNLRSLRNFLHLRTGKSALLEIRQLAFAIYLAIPVEQRFLVNDVLNVDVIMEDMKNGHIPLLEICHPDHKEELTESKS